MDEVRVASWSQLNEELFHGSWQAGLGRFRSHFAFRGQSDCRLDLTTSLMRLGGAYDKQEGHLLRNFRKYALRDATAWLDSVWTWLAMGQHYGLPTRLLDWTYSPFVALHFATQDLDCFDRDGVIWCVDYVKTNELLPESLKSVLEEEGSDVFTVEMLDRVSPTLADFARLAEEPFVVFLEPPSLDDRIVNQFALFSLISRVTARMDEWLRQHPKVCRRIVLPAALKWEVRDKLDQANINERVLFTGLDGLSRWLTRYYSPRTP
jgi:FRG domain-containing protein